MCTYYDGDGFTRSESHGLIGDLTFLFHSQSGADQTRAYPCPYLDMINTMFKKSVLSLALLLAIVEIGSCLDCFHCDSQQDPQCGVILTSTVKPLSCASQDSLKFNQLNLYQTLPSEVFGGIEGAPKYCHKIVMENGKVIRTCLDGNASILDQSCKALKDDTMKSTSDKKVVSCFVCDKDSCNGAGALSFSLPLSALTLLISYLVYKQ